MRRCCVALQRLNSARPAVGMLLTFLKPMPRQHKRPLSLTSRPTHLPPSAPTADNLIHVFGPRSGCFILFLTVGPRGRARLGRHTKFVGQKPTGTAVFRNRTHYSLHAGPQQSLPPFCTPISLPDKFFVKLFNYSTQHRFCIREHRSCSREH